MGIHALRQESLRKLADCLEAGRGEDRELDASVANATGYQHGLPPHFTTRQQNALWLVKDLSHEERIETMHQAVLAFGKTRARSRDYPRFICAAALRTMASQLEEESC